MWRLALIGCGNIAGGYDEQSGGEVCQTHARACQLLPQVELIAACDHDPGKAKRFAARWEASSSHSDAGEMLARTEPDIVSICSPADTHIEMLERCLEFPGLRAVLCEKPAGLDPNRLAPLLPRFQAAGVVLAVDYIRAYSPGIQRWRQRLAALGGCVEATVDYGKGIFSYGSHAIQWLADWLGEITNVAVTGARAGTGDADPNVDATFHAGATPTRLRGATADRFDIEFRCAGGDLRFFNYSYEGECGPEKFSTGLDTAMLNVFSNLVARLEARPARLVEGGEALATLKVCGALAAQTRSFNERSCLRGTAVLFNAADASVRTNDERGVP
jgi:predicted dehydrogenase